VGVGGGWVVGWGLGVGWVGGWGGGWVKLRVDMSSAMWGKLVCLLVDRCLSETLARVGVTLHSMRTYGWSPPRWPPATWHGTGCAWSGLHPCWIARVLAGVVIARRVCPGVLEPHRYGVWAEPTHHLSTWHGAGCCLHRHMVVAVVGCVSRSVVPYEC
jgi:hypothetical protein